MTLFNKLTSHKHFSQIRLFDKAFKVDIYVLHV